jgi:uncharacterized protein
MPVGHPKNILILKDLRPGHYNQSEGIAKALGRLYEVNVERISVPEKGLLPQRSLRWLLARKWLPQFAQELLNLSYRMRPSKAPDLIVSAGGATMVPNVLLARRFGCPNLYSGQIRNIAASEYSLFLNQRPSFKKYQNCIVVLKPSPVDLREIEPMPDCPVSYCALLVGGPTSKHRFTKDEWDQLVRWIETDKPRNWVITTSRRTPADWLADLNSLARQKPDRITLFDYTKTGPGDAINIAFGADAVFVTCDSDSMISESIACRKPVVSLQADDLRITDDDADYLNWMEDKGWVHFTEISSLADMDIEQTVKIITPMKTDHLDQLAEMIAQKLSL